MNKRAMAERPLWPRRNWWLALLVILVLAGALRYPGYAFSLPYVDYIDEPNHNLAARMLVDFGSARSIGHDSYPPASSCSITSSSVCFTTPPRHPRP